MGEQGKVSILGIGIESGTARDEVERIGARLADGAVSAVEIVSSKTLIEALRSQEMADTLRSMDFVVAGEKAIWQAAGNLAPQWTRDMEENEFAREFLSWVERKGRTIFLLGAESGKITTAWEQLHSFYRNLRIIGSYALEDCKGDFDAVVNEMNTFAPDIVFSVLPVPLQEHFLAEHRKQMNALVWLGVGDSRQSGGGHGLRGMIRNHMEVSRLKAAMRSFGGGGE